MRFPLITLTSDFGLADGYVGAMKGVILSIAPAAALVDLTHQIPPQDVRAGAYALSQAAGEFPAGTVHLAVVDPGVGGPRRALAVRARGCLWVGPDNGLFTHVLGDPAAAAEARQLSHTGLARPDMSATFHGRDLFAPAAAHLASGFPFAEVGPPVTDPVRLAAPQPRRDGADLIGEVVHVDGFGNLITNLPAAMLDALPGRPTVRVEADTVVAGLSATYGSVPDGDVVALIGSGGLLEIGVNGGSAADTLRLGRGSLVTVHPL